MRETEDTESRRVLTDAAQKVAVISAAQRVLYQGDQHSSFAAKAFMESVGACVRDMLPLGVTVRWNADDIHIDNDTAIPLALILNELITNAARHAIDRDGNAQIQIRLIAGTSACTLHVQDSGPGFTWQLTPRRASGLGLVQGLVAQIEGRLRLEPGPGAHWVIEIPNEERST